MDNSGIYNDIALRTGGDIFIGVVGPVRSGKSTFIKKFIESSVMPNIENEYDRNRTRDELPQSAGGRTVMTTEPKFVPDEADTITVGESAKMRVKMIDCVGYMIPEAISKNENGEMRMVHTPWNDEPVPFDVAAETGTSKVIKEHSTIGILVTTDGTIGDIPRDSFVAAEERVAAELREIGKPFAVILNTADPSKEEAEALAEELEAKYKAPIALVNCLELNKDDIDHILEMILMEFPLKELTLEIPGWAGALGREHPLMRRITEAAKVSADKAAKMGDISSCYTASVDDMLSDFSEGDGTTGICDTVASDMGTGKVRVRLRLPDNLYYSVVSEITGTDIGSEKDIIRTLKHLSDVSREYAKFAEAIDSVNEKGYGIVMPDIEDMTLEEPVMVKQAGGYGVKLRASAPSIHMIKAEIETELNPVVGTEQQSEELVKSMLREFEEDPQKLWDSNMFGKSLYDLVNDGLHAKLAHMPDDARSKLSETLAQIINEGSGGLICIIL